MTIMVKNNYLKNLRVFKESYLLLNTYFKRITFKKKFYKKLIKLVFFELNKMIDINKH